MAADSCIGVRCSPTDGSCRPEHGRRVDQNLVLTLSRACVAFQGYDVYAVKNGDKATFTLTGDGGDINWGFIGSKIQRNGKTLQMS